MGVMRSMVMVVATLAACGDGRTESPDGGVQVNGEAGVVSVRYLADASNLAGLLVYFQNADSTIALATRTDGEGRATAFMRSGGFVTVVVPNGTLWTYAQVAVGDDLVIDERTLETTEQRTTFMLRVPPTVGADIYSLTTSCGSTDITGAQDEPTVATLGNCDGVTDLLIMARSSEPRPFGSNHRYLYRKDVVLEGQDMIVVEGEYADVETSMITATNVPAEIPRLAISQSLVRAGREVSPTKFGLLDVTDGAATLSFSRTYAPADGTTMTRIAPRDATTVGVHNIVQWGPSSTRTIVDAGIVRLRPYLDRPRFQPEASLVRWEEASEGTVANAVLAVLTFPRSEITPEWRWTIVAPRGEDTTLRLPVLPRAELVAPADAVISELSSVSIDGGYDRIRPYLLGVWQQDGVWPADTDAGRVDYQRLSPP
jgi:hypothetical protein